MGEYHYDGSYPYLQQKATWLRSGFYSVSLGIRTAAEVVDPLKLKKDHSVLDVGCGLSETNLILRGLGIKAFGVEINEAAILAGRRLLNANHTAPAHATHLPFPDHSFDAVFSRDLLEHLNYRELILALKEMRRVGKGKMLHMVTVIEDGESMDNDPSHIIKQPACWWASLFIQLGWQITADTTRHYLHRQGFLLQRVPMHGYFLLEEIKS